MRRCLVQIVVVAGLALTAGAAPHSSAAVLPGDGQSDDRTIVHILNRIGFGPRPGDVDKVRALGLQRYIDQQLRPERIEDGAVEVRLAELTTIRMSLEEIRTTFEQPQIEARRLRQAASVKAPLKTPGVTSAPTSGSASGGTPADTTASNTDAQPPAPSPAMQARNNQVMLELSEQKLLRAIYSERQLQEVLTDFWFNHFNVDARKGRDRYLLTAYERDAIRPHVLGKFRELLGATARSPAMLFYLDNWMSVDPDAIGLNNIAQPGNRQKRGLNENYGRELMELHTLGVDAGYTQKDVTEVARAFTGWTIGNPRQGGGYRFEARLHDPGEKLVLGHRIKAGGGINDGEQVLDILAAHPSTARFIATKLVRRFVNDTPPASLVDRAAARFHDTDGDIKEVMRTILTSPEFLAPEANRAKVKSPFELIVSTIRATGAEVQSAMPLVRAVQQLGMPLYACQPPTGYKDTADAWVSTGALVGRMNFALALAGDRLRGITIDNRQWGLDSSTSAVDGQSSVINASGLVDSILYGNVSASTRATIARATTAAQMAALTLGSPEFQRR